MNSRFKIRLELLGILTLVVTLSACQDTIPKRATISPNQSVGSSDKKPDAKGIVRPTNAIQFKTDFCICKDAKAVSYGNCSSFCASKNTNGAEIFYANFSVTEDIALSGLGSVHGWCTAPLPDDPANPKCILEAKDETGNKVEIEVTPLAGTNSIAVNLQEALQNDKTYVMTLVETISKAKSNSIQLVKFSSDTGIPVIGPLKNAPISQYTCLSRIGGPDDIGNTYFDYAFRLHFVYHPRIPPSPIPAGTTNFVCHDIFNPLYGLQDDELYPRLENIPGVFNLWDNTDPRFYDNNGNGTADVNDIIIQKTKNFGGTIPAGTKFFLDFKWMGPPNLNTEAGNSNTDNSQSIGYFMAPWIDQQNFKSYCLNTTHYNSSNPLFKAMRDIIEVDTEGLYVGVKSSETVTVNGTSYAGPMDYVLIRETDLKQVWFYLKNGVPTAPTDDNVANVAVYFYYPLNKTSPFVKTSTQRIYRIRGAQELANQSNQSSNSAGENTSYPPHDRRIGCVPKF